MNQKSDRRVGRTTKTVVLRTVDFYSSLPQIQVNPFTPYVVVYGEPLPDDEGGLFADIQAFPVDASKAKGIAALDDPVLYDEEFCESRDLTDLDHLIAKKVLRVSYPDTITTGVNDLPNFQDMVNEDLIGQESALSSMTSYDNSEEHTDDR